MNRKKVYWSTNFTQDDVKLLKPEQAIESGNFSLLPQEDTESDFSIRLIPKGVLDKDRNFFMSVLLKLDGTIPCDMELQFDLVGKDMQTLKSVTRPVVKNNYPPNARKVCWGAKKFIQLKTIFDDPAKFTPYGQITFGITVTCKINKDDQASLLGITSATSNEPNGKEKPAKLRKLQNVPLTAQKTLPHLRNHKQIYGSESLSDIEVMARGGRLIKAHKVILASGSSVLKVLIEADPFLRIVDLSQHSFNVVDNMLRFIYYRKVEATFRECMFELYAVAADFDQPGLMTICINEIEKCITSRFSDVIGFAVKHQLSSLFDKCVDEMRQNFHRLKLDGTLNKLDQDTLVKVLEKVFTRPIDEIELN